MHSFDPFRFLPFKSRLLLHSLMADQSILILLPITWLYNGHQLTFRLADSHQSSSSLLSFLSLFTSIIFIPSLIIHLSLLYLFEGEVKLLSNYLTKNRWNLTPCLFVCNCPCRCLFINVCQAFTYKYLVITETYKCHIVPQTCINHDIDLGGRPGANGDVDISPHIFPPEPLRSSLRLFPLRFH